MTVLALDSTMAACSAAVWANGGIAARRRELRLRGHAESLVPMVAAVLEEARIDCAELDAIAATRGPGTFAGVRIGLAAACGLALACARPLVGLSSLEALAAGAEAFAAGRPVVVAAEARRGQVYAQRFPEGPPPAAMSAAAAAALAPEGPVAVAGDAAARVAALMGARAAVAPGDGLPDAADAARLALGRAPRRAPPAPLYLRAPGARLPAAR